MNQSTRARSAASSCSLIRHIHIILVLAAFVCLAGTEPSRALDANELALVVNRNMPDGMQLAQFYAQQRHIPDNRIIELDLPRTESMSFPVYERDVVPQIREFLRLNDPTRQVKCLVTFYGVPFRIDAHEDTPQETAELKMLHAQAKELGQHLRDDVAQAEAMALSLDAGFKPNDSAVGPLGQAADPSLKQAAAAGELTGPELDPLLRRANDAAKSIVASIRKMNDPDEHRSAESRLLELVQTFTGPVVISDAPTTVPSSAQSLPQTSTPDAVLAALPLDDRRFDPAARQQIRERAAAAGGLAAYCRLILGQIAYLSPEDTLSATDSELALLWWTFYPRPRWQLNPLCYRFGTAPSAPVLMVSRLDAPDPKIVRQMIIDSIHAEQQGLRGRIVIDARGLPLNDADGKPDGYGFYDDKLRRLAAIVQTKTTMPVTFDDKPAVLPAHSQQDVAIYCGWYSVGKYIPACSFVPGAVGFHVASFEMVSLRDPHNTGWVRGLLNDGIAATLGPVDEPYLTAFPPADEFFPLLLTGKLTLAEAYWKTEVMASWRMCLVGDPLYTPFKANPQLKVSDLSPRLQDVFSPNSSGN